MPIIDLKLDRIAATRFKAQSLLYEMQNIGNVFTALARRKGGSSSDELKVGERGICEALDLFLKTSLNDLVTRLNVFCVSGG